LSESGRLRLLSNLLEKGLIEKREKAHTSRSKASAAQQNALVLLVAERKYINQNQSLGGNN
jgi:hypothetical protein